MAAWEYGATAHERQTESLAIFRELGQGWPIALTVHGLGDVELNLGPGTYYLGVYLYRYDVEREYDHVFPATSFVVTTDRDTRGSANLYPAVARFESAAPLALVRAVGN